ncbi:MAG: hypothetical protein WEB60_15070, partial [Terrimicrobiaceae bacterium]
MDFQEIRTTRPGLRVRSASRILGINGRISSKIRFCVFQKGENLSLFHSGKILKKFINRVAAFKAIKSSTASR